jgi:peroxiredoxin
MRKLIAGIILVGVVAAIPSVTAQQENIASLDGIFATEDGTAALRVPSDWYLSANEDENQSVLIAAPNAERAAAWQSPGPVIVHLYTNRAPDANPQALLSKTLKDHALEGITLTESEISIMGISGRRYEGQSDELRTDISILNIPESDLWLRFVATASVDEWDSGFVESLRQTIAILPQTAKVPRGWVASIRAPQGWDTSEFSSFIQWTAPQDGPLAGMEVWFQAGFRTDLIGQGETPFVLRSLGVNYTSQVDESSSYATDVSGLPATAVSFESFTHTGLAINTDGGSDYGTANLIARVPSGRWTPEHQMVFEAIRATVSIVPPSGDAAPVGLRPGYRAPDFEGRIDGGDDFSLDDFEGQLVFVHFWFVNCPYCREEWPGLQSVYDEYRDDGMVLLAINALDPPAYIEAYTESEGLDFPLVRDDGTLHNLYGVTAFPSTFVVGPDGVIVRMARGPLSERSLRNLVEEHLGD